MAAKVDLVDKARQTPLKQPKSAYEAGRLERKVGTRLKRISNKLKRIKKLETEILELDLETIQLCEAIRGYATMHRGENEQSTYLHSSGHYEWSPTSRIVLLVAEETAVANLRRMGLERLIRVEESVKKDAVADELKSNAALLALVNGIEKVDNELFIIRPNGTAIQVKYDPYVDKYTREASPKRTVMPRPAKRAA